MKLKELLFTFFYAGYSPLAPGTAGTLFGAIIYVLLAFIVGSHNIWIANLILVIVCMAPFFWLSGEGERYYGYKDPEEVVVDEAMGFWVSMLFFTFSWKVVILAFVLFRIFDIFKPYPINSLQKYREGIGIMLDDLVAGIFANVLIMISIVAGKLILGYSWAGHVFLFR